MSKKKKPVINTGPTYACRGADWDGTSTVFIGSESVTWFDTCDECKGEGTRKCCSCNGTGECPECGGNPHGKCFSCKGEKKSKCNCSPDCKVMKKCVVCSGKTLRCWKCNGKKKCTSKTCTDGVRTCSDCDSSGYNRYPTLCSVGRNPDHYEKIGYDTWLAVYGVELEEGQFVELKWK